MTHPANLSILAVATAVVEQAGKILLIQEAKATCRGKWFLPGGRSDIAEPIIDTVVREVKEESGIIIELDGLLYVDQLVDTHPQENINRLRFAFAARPVGGQLKREADKHSLKAAWFSAAEIQVLETQSYMVKKLVTLYESKPVILPISSLHVLTQEDKKLERP